MRKKIFTFTLVKSRDFTRRNRTHTFLGDIHRAWHEGQLNNSVAFLFPDLKAPFCSFENVYFCQSPHFSSSLERANFFESPTDVSPKKGLLLKVKFEKKYENFELQKQSYLKYLENIGAEEILLNLAAALSNSRRSSQEPQLLYTRTRPNKIESTLVESGPFCDQEYSQAPLFQKGSGKSVASIAKTPFRPTLWAGFDGSRSEEIEIIPFKPAVDQQNDQAQSFQSDKENARSSSSDQGQLPQEDLNEPVYSVVKNPAEPASCQVFDGSKSEEVETIPFKPAVDQQNDKDQSFQSDNENARSINSNKTSAGNSASKSFKFSLREGKETSLTQSDKENFCGNKFDQISVSKLKGKKVLKPKASSPLLANATQDPATDTAQVKRASSPKQEESTLVKSVDATDNYPGLLVPIFQKFVLENGLTSDAAVMKSFNSVDIIPEVCSLLYVRACVRKGQPFDKVTEDSVSLYTCRIIDCIVRLQEQTGSVLMEDVLQYLLAKLDAEKKKLDEEVTRILLSKEENCTKKGELDQVGPLKKDSNAFPIVPSKTSQGPLKSGSENKKKDFGFTSSKANKENSEISPNKTSDWKSSVSKSREPFSPNNQNTFALQENKIPHEESEHNFDQVKLAQKVTDGNITSVCQNSACYTVCENHDVNTLMGNSLCNAAQLGEENFYESDFGQAFGPKDP